MDTVLDTQRAEFDDPLTQQTNKVGEVTKRYRTNLGMALQDLPELLCRQSDDQRIRQGDHGRGTWLATHAVVAAGVTVGKGNLIAANAVVTRDTPENVVVGGIPAKVLRPREDNPGETVSRHD